MPTSEAVTAMAPPAPLAGPTFDAAFARRFAWACGLMPVVMLAWDAYRGQLGVNAVNYAIRTTGLVGLVCLVAALAITPLRRLTRWPTVVAARRPLGLLGFGYIALHFAIFFWFDRDHDLGSTVEEVVERRYLQIGTAALLCMVPLAITSTDRMVARLGPRRWKLLHRLTYVVVIGGVVHFWLLVKADTSRPRAFAVVVGGLLLLRVVGHYLELLARAARAVAAPSPATTAAARPWRGVLKVARVFDETHDVRTYRLVPPDGGALPFTHQPGQYLTLELTIDGQRVFRSYTIASPPTRTGAIEITVKRLDGGRGGSRHVHAALVEGSLVTVRGPHGDFVFTGAGHDRVTLIAGGVGITPVMSMLRAATDRAWPGRIDLIYGVRTERDLVFGDELEHLAARFPNLKVHRVASSPDAAPSWTGARGNLTRDRLAELVPDVAAAPVYLCGPAPMMAAVTQSLIDLGVPAAAIHTEAFAGGTAPPTDTPAGEVAFARAGKRAPGLTVLDAADACGADLPNECRSGICGQCKIRVTRGEVVHAAFPAITARERADGWVLACQARPVGEIVVDA